MRVREVSERGLVGELMGNVKELERAADPALIAELEALTRMARAGNMVGFAIMVNKPDGYYFQECGCFSDRDLLLAIELRKRRILNGFQPEE